MAALTVSPLAPPTGFPNLPVISGVRFSSAASGVKYLGRDDVMLAEIAPGSAIAGVFTKSSTRSSAVLDCQTKVGFESDRGAAFLVNSGNANAFTGAYGNASVKALTGELADVLGVESGRIFTASTGVIGEPLVHEKIIEKLELLKSTLSDQGAETAARAIMTTDTFAKGSFAELTIDGNPVRISGFAKGSGMIAPDMATMLAFVFTDAKISRAVLQSMVEKATQSTFNSVTVDTDTSTSDTLLVAATGQSGAPEISTLDSDNAGRFYRALHQVMLDLAHQLVRDGEGATKFVEVVVSGAIDECDAKKVARSVADSPLVKTAIAGEDPNWGRIVMAVGKSGAEANRDTLSIRFGDILVAESGWVSANYTEAEGVAYMKRQELTIAVDLGLGDAKATVWTCDLTHGYIEINADYRS